MSQSHVTITCHASDSPPHTQHVCSLCLPLQALNQDAFFAVQPSASLAVWGVLDGHGPDNGRLASQAAAAAMSSYFTSEEGQAAVAEAPKKAMVDAFEQAHAAIRHAIVRKYESADDPLIATAEGLLVEGEGGEPVDGGATATVVALVNGQTLVVANAGDSDALVGGLLHEGGGLVWEQLCADHTPTNVDEFIRVQGGGFGGHAQFVYDAEPPIDIFAISADGEVSLNAEAEASLEECGVGFKTVRGERPTAMIVPSTRQYGEQKLGITRALGDFYLQSHGVSWEPAVSAVDLVDISQTLSRITLVLGSDGLWDLWKYRDALEVPLGVAQPATGVDLMDPLADLVEQTRKHGEELFGETADNITAVVAAFHLGDFQRGGARSSDLL